MPAKGHFKIDPTEAATIFAEVKSGAEVSRHAKWYIENRDRIRTAQNTRNRERKTEVGQ